MKKLTLLLLLFLLAGIQLLQAQGLQITGTVKSAASEQPLPGVSILAKGTTLGTVTNSEGTYKLTVPAEVTTLVFSFVGMSTQEIIIGGRTKIDVEMIEEASKLEEIVVVGYSTQKKMDITGSVSVVDAEALVSQPATSLGKQLQGRAAGVTVSTSGDPSSDVSIRIRGIGTINDNGPLIVIDGVSTRDQNMNNINPNDIESVQILKDASSSSIYGAQASNGVIIITTKHGKQGKAQIHYNGYYGVQKAIKWYDLLNTDEWIQMWQKAEKTAIILQNWGLGINTNKTFESLYNDNTNLWGNPNDTVYNIITHPQFGNLGSPHKPKYVVPSGQDNVDESTWSPSNRIARIGNTDWFKEISQIAPIQSHQLAASGGSENGNYSFSFNYYNQDGIIKTTNLNRYTFRANSELKVKNHIKFGENFTFAYTQSHSAGNQDEGWALSMAYRLVPWIPVYDVKGNFAGTTAESSGNGDNPVAMLMRAKDNKDRNLRMFGNLFAEINFLKYLTFRTSFGLDYNTGNGYSMSLPNPESSEPVTEQKFNEYANWGYRWVYNNTLNFSKQFGDSHNLTLLVGTEAIHDGVGRHMDGTRKDYAFANDINTWTLDNGATLGMSNSSYFYGEFTLFGMFARADYSYKDKYLLTAIARRDGVSRFSQSNLFGTFPSVSLGWRISREPFMQSVTLINDLKLRAGYGITGNSEIPRNYNYAYTYGYDATNLNYDISGANTGSATGMKLTAYGNPDTKWEESRMSNVGIDLAILNNALEVNLDGYVKNTSGMLVEDAYTSLAGGVTPPYVNLGQMRNTGFDLGITHRGKTGEFRYDLTATISHYKNEVVKISNNDLTKFYGGGASRFGDLTVIEKGKPISSFYGYIIEGIYKNETELRNHAVQPGINNDSASLAPGSTAWMASIGKFKFKDINKDGIINEDDKTIIGNPHPDFTYSLDVNLSYKNFELNIFLVGSQGNDIYNYVKWWTDFNGSFLGNKSKAILTDSWDPVKDANRDTKLPILDFNNTTDANYSTSYYVENGSFLRCKNLQLSYNFPKTLLTRIGLDNLKIYGQITNLFTITRYSGLDPDVGSLNYGGGGDWEKGLDFGHYPLPRTFLVGIMLSL